MATSGAKKWAYGCGMGCFVILLIIGGLGMVSYFVLDNFSKDIDKFSVQQTELYDVTGKIQGFHPPFKQLIEPDRLDVFLKIRTTLKAKTTGITAWI